MAVFAVTNSAQLASALASARSGDRIELAPGDYGDLAIRSRSFSSPVTIAAKDPGNPPTFDSVALMRVSNLTFDGIKIDFTPTATTVEWSSAFRADGSTGITVRNSVIDGGPAVAGISPDAPAGTQGSSGIMGYPIGRGMTFINSSNITVANNTITEFTAGIRLDSNIKNIRIIDNEISDFRRAGIGGHASDITIQGNYIHDANPWKYGWLGDHSDFIHLWTKSTQVGPSANITITGNRLSQGDGAPIVGIYLDDENHNKGFSGVRVENNTIQNGHSLAVLMEDVVGLTVRSNTIVQTMMAGSEVPRIVLADGTRDVLVTDNIMAGIDGAALSAAGSNIRVIGNLIAQAEDPQAPNYIGNILVNPLATHATVQDLRPVPGGPAAGFGAEFPLPSKGLVFIGSIGGTGMDMDAHGFGIRTIAGPQGTVDLTGAKVSWAFGDGVAGTGTKVLRDYDSFGLHEVRATVTLQDGTSFLLKKVINVSNPVSVAEDFDGAATSGFTLQNGARLVAGPDGDMAARVVGDKASVKFDYDKQMTKNTEFTISFDFRKDPGAEGSGGRALTYVGTAVVDIGADGISLRGRTDIGESIVLSARNIGIRDSDWHRVTYTFSKSDGTAILYVDGTEIDRVEGLKGSQFVSGPNSLHLGNPFGTSGFRGLLDDPVFLRDSIDPGHGSDLLAAPHQTGDAPVLADSFTSYQQVWAASGYALF